MVPTIQYPFQQYNFGLTSNICSFYFWEQIRIIRLYSWLFCEFEIWGFHGFDSILLTGTLCRPSTLCFSISLFTIRNINEQLRSSPSLTYTLKRQPNFCRSVQVSSNITNNLFYTLQSNSRIFSFFDPTVFVRLCENKHTPDS